MRLDVGTPSELVDRRGLLVAEMEVGHPIEAADLLRACPEVDEVSHFGPDVRVATHDGTPPIELARRVLGGQGITIKNERTVRATVEDAFVSIVRRQEAVAA